MAFRVMKIAGCEYSKDSLVYRVALLEMRKQNKEFFRFALHLKAVSGGVCRLMYLEDREEEKSKIIERYFSPEGGVTKDFPRPQSDRWKNTQPWLVQVSDGEIGIWMKIIKPIALSRRITGRPNVGSRSRRKRKQLSKVIM